MSTGVAAAEHPPGATSDGGRPQERQRRWARRLAIGLAVTVCAVALGLVTNDEVMANTRFDQTHLALNATHGHLSVVRTNLAIVRKELTTVNGQVGVDATALSQATSQLQGVETSLANARTSVSNQTKAMADLQLCLDGVEQGLNALSVGDRVHALNSLNAVSSSCTAAIVANG